MHVAVLGTGRMAGERLRALAGDPHVRRVTVAGRDERRCAALAASVGGCGVPLSAALEDVPDAAVVTLATGAHGEALRACLERRVPVLCEKPLSESLPESRALADGFDQAGVPLHVGFQRRFDPGLVALRAAIADGSVGRLYHVRIAAHDAEPGDDAYIATSGGMFRDLHVHDFDLLRWLTGEEIVEVDAVGGVRGHERYARHGDVDVTALLLTTSGGTPALVTGSRHDPAGYDVRAEVLGSRAAVGAGITSGAAPRALDPGAPPPPGTRFEGFLDRFADAFWHETRAFTAAVAGHEEAPAPGRAAVAALRVAVAAEQSCRDGRRVRVADVDEHGDRPAAPDGR